MFVRKDKNKRKIGWGWPILKQINAPIWIQLLCYVKFINIFWFNPN